jgi:hypothetical protein
MSEPSEHPPRNAEPLRSGNILIGWVTPTGFDMFWTLGTFAPEFAFEPHRALFERVPILNDLLKDEEDEIAHDRISDEAMALVDKINDLHLTLGDPPDPSTTSSSSILPIALSTRIYLGSTALGLDEREALKLRLGSTNGSGRPAGATPPTTIVSSRS